MRRVNILHPSCLNPLAVVFLSALLLFSTNVSAAGNGTLKEVDRSIRLRDYAQAVQQLQPLLEQGNAAAQYRMAGLYRSGKGVKKDTEKALELYQKAAEKGMAEAQYVLASLLEKQSSTRNQLQTVIKWYSAAARQGHRKAKRKLAALKNRNQAVSTDNINHDSIFSDIRINNLNKIKGLIEQGIDFNFVDNKQRSPFMSALLSQHQEMAQLLLPHVRQLNSADVNHDYPIHIATSNGYRKIVEALLNKNVDVNVTDRLGNTPLILATRHDDGELVKLLLSHGADSQIKNKKNQTAPQIAKTLSLKNAMTAFKQKGIKLPSSRQNYAKTDLKTFQASIAKTDNIYKGWPLINIASLLGEYNIVDQLIKQGVDINQTDSNGNTALHRAASKGQLKVVKLLIANNIRINAVNKKQQTALWVAAAQGKFKVVKYQLKRHANTSILSQNNHSPLSIAIINHHPATARLLANKKLDVKAIHRTLLLAMQNAMEGISVTLIKRDKLLPFSYKNNRSALWYSADLGLEKATRTLLDSNKVDIDLKDNKGYSALARAAYHGYDKIFENILSHKAKITGVTVEGNTLLMLATLSGNHKIIRSLLKAGAFIDAKNKAGDSALILAATRGDLATVKLLIAAKADMHTRNKNDLNAYESALNAGHKKTAQYIRDHSSRLFKLFN